MVMLSGWEGWQAYSLTPLLITATLDQKVCDISKQVTLKDRCLGVM